MKSLDAAGVQIKPTKVVAILPHNEGIELQDAAAPELVWNLKGLELSGSWRQAPPFNPRDGKNTKYRGFLAG